MTNAEKWFKEKENFLITANRPNEGEKGEIEGKKEGGKESKRESKKEG